MSHDAAQVTSDAVSQPHYAGWLRRALGFFIDMIPYLILTGIAQLSFSHDSWGTIQSWTGSQFYEVYQAHGPGPAYYILIAIAIVYLFVNKGWLEGKTGRSIGKYLTGMTTVRESDGQAPGVGRGFLRALLVYIEFLLIGLCFLGLILWLWPLWDSQNQALFSDRGTKTVVILNR